MIISKKLRQQFFQVSHESYQVLDSQHTTSPAIMNSSLYFLFINRHDVIWRDGILQLALPFDRDE